MRMGQGVGTGLGHRGITCVLQTQFSSYPKFTAVGFFSKGLNNEFETAMVKESSVFEPLKSTVISKYLRDSQILHA